MDSLKQRTFKSEFCAYFSSIVFVLLYKFVAYFQYENFYLLDLHGSVRKRKGKNSVFQTIKSSYSCKSWKTAVKTSLLSDKKQTFFFFFVLHLAVNKD